MKRNPSGSSLEGVYKIKRTADRVSTSRIRRRSASPKRIPVQYRTRISALYSAARKGGRLRLAQSAKRWRTSFSPREYGRKEDSVGRCGQIGSATVPGSD